MLKFFTANQLRINLALFFALLAVPATAAELTASAHREIGTHTAADQRLFDRGLLMLYAFNMGEAHAIFAKLAARRPHCAMAYWGQAAAKISDINVPPDDIAFMQSRRYALQAMHGTAATAADRALISALATRFSAAHDSASQRNSYARAMQRYIKRYPQDSNGAVFAVLAMWAAHDPTDDRREAAQIGATLDRARTVDSQNIGVRHMRIHYYEATGRPQFATADATYLSQLSYGLGQSHLPHMAGHISLRLGDYAGVAAANRIALRNDAAYFRTGDGPGQAYMADYHVHVVMNYLYAQTTIGNDRDALAAASAPPALSLSWVQVRDHHWPVTQQINNLGDAVAVGVASARHGDFPATNRMKHLIASTYRKEQNADADLLLIDAAIAQRRKQWKTVLHAYEKLYRDYAYDSGDPPDAWDLPIPEGYGAVLLRCGYWRAADQIFAQALQHRPNDPRLLFGLAIARQRMGLDSTQAWNAYRKIWRGARPLTIDDLG